MKIYKFWLVAVTFLLVALLAACGGSDEPASAPEQEAAEPAAESEEAATEEESAAEEESATEEETAEEVVVIEPFVATTSDGKARVVFFVGMGTGSDPDQIAVQEALVSEFNATHDDIEVEMLVVPHDSAPERFLAMVAGGSPPQVVGPIGIANVAEFFDVWADVSPLIEADGTDLSDFYGPAVDLQTYPDKTIGLPLGLYPSFLFYNADLFDAAGLDYPTHDYSDTSWNLDALRESAIELTLDVNSNPANSADFDAESIAQWGYDDSWTDLRGALTMFGAESGGRPTSEDYKTAVANSPEWVYGLQWLSDGTWVDHFIPDAAGQDAYYAVGGDPFGGELVAMFYSHTWFMSEGLVDLPFEYDIAPLPYNQNGERIARVHADTFVIPEGAENKEAAWEFIKWMTDAERIVDVCEIYGCVPARQSVQAEYTQLLEERYPGLDYDVIFDAINYLDTPNHEGWIPEWGRNNDALNVAWENILIESVDAQEILDGANDEVQAILDEYWAGQ